MSPEKKHLSNTQNKGLFRFCYTLRHALAGLKAAWKYEESFRQECFLSLLFIPLGIYFGDGAIEKLLLAGSIFFLLIVELANSAIETAVDRISEEYHELSGRAKDIGSAMVMLTLFLILATWLSIFLPKIW